LVDDDVVAVVAVVAVVVTVEGVKGTGKVQANHAPANP
jgi:hypothetical protein